MSTISDNKTTSLFDNYHQLKGCYDEYFSANGNAHHDISNVVKLLENLEHNKIKGFQRLANDLFKVGGITFTLHSDNEFFERILPFDLIPRIINYKQWQHLANGLKQRVAALNAFLADIYGKQHILNEGIVPRYLIESSHNYIPWLRGVLPPNNVFIHVAGIDIVRDNDGNFIVLEDNVRTPSGVSYALENRVVMQRLFPNLMNQTKILAIDDYPLQLKKSLHTLTDDEGLTVVLTPGEYNSAYYEHSFLARMMGCPLVQGNDLFVDDKKVFLKTIHGNQRVTAIYRRIDDDFLDPNEFREDSELGVSGLMKAYIAGNVVLTNAVGNGVADDKAIYAYIPDIIRFYLSEEPILGQVPTLHCLEPKYRQHVLKNLHKFVVKATDACGGFGMLIGPQASKEQLAFFSDKIKAHPRNYIAQPLLELSSCPTFCDGDINPRRVDLRPYVVTGKSSWVMPGGLSRVALAKNSYVVNSCQGGGAKDTWVIGE